MCDLTIIIILYFACGGGGGGLAAGLHRMTVTFRTKWLYYLPGEKEFVRCIISDACVFPEGFFQVGCGLICHESLCSRL